MNGLPQIDALFDIRTECCSCIAEYDFIFAIRMVACTTIWNDLNMIHMYFLITNPFITNHMVGSKIVKKLPVLNIFGYKKLRN